MEIDNITMSESIVSEESKKLNVMSLDKRLRELESKVSQIENDILVSKPQLGGVVFNAPNAIPSDYQPKGYVPQKYRQIVDEILSSEFGFDVEESPESMDFTIKIVVPEKYSALTAVEKQAKVKDIRSKVISRALGENGVREWCIKVRENLNKFYTSSGVISPFTKQ